MRLFSALLRFCLLYLLFTADKGLGKSADLSSSSSSSSSVSQEKAMVDGECGIVVQESVLLRLMRMMNITLSHLQDKKSAEEATDFHGEDSLYPVPSMQVSPEELSMEGGSCNQRLLLTLWESEADKSQLRRELLQMKQEMDQYKQELYQLKEIMKMEKSFEKDNATKECHPCPCPQHNPPPPPSPSHHDHHRIRHHHDHLQSSSSSTGANENPVTNELFTAITKSDLVETILDAVYMKLNVIDCNSFTTKPETQKQGFHALGWPPKDCYDLFKFGGVTKSGIYVIHPIVDGSEGGVRVWCDMGDGEGGEEEETEEGGGWTVILQRRPLTHPVNFKRGWEEYKKGFGEAEAEYWIGNEALHQLTSSSEGKPQQALHVEMTDWDNVTKVAFYWRFAVGSEEDKFPLEVGFFYTNRSSVLGDSLDYHNGTKFSTADQDNDEWDYANCALDRGGGGFWYKSCYYALPTGPILPKGESGYGLYWYHFNNDWSTYLKSLKMKIKPSG